MGVGGDPVAAPLGEHLSPERFCAQLCYPHMGWGPDSRGGAQPTRNFQSLSVGSDRGALDRTIHYWEKSFSLTEGKVLKGTHMSRVGGREHPHCQSDHPINPDDQWVADVAARSPSRLELSSLEPQQATAVLSLGEGLCFFWG